ncbi:hypothetical protein SELMODRAFT_413012 [Selaginella moellendorffii]|uniref:Uncharacterized protein n=1 Tax=Selaginella moellendorffii TaxID=88036 RepID=D8RN23_SELML|nr:hypothetical protein SELMODRAFT_413012 [Selaginella moellendorffii]
MKRQACSRSPALHKLSIRAGYRLEERDGKRGLEEREEQGLGLEQRVEHVEGLLQLEEEHVEGLEGDQGLEAKGLEAEKSNEKKNRFKTSRAIKGWKLMEQRFTA